MNARLKLQSDGSTCGFWALFIALSILLQFEDSLSKLRLSAPELKALLSKFYGRIQEGEHGATVSDLHQLFARFQPGYDLAAHPETLVVCSTIQIGSLQRLTTSVALSQTTMVATRSGGTI